MNIDNLHGLAKGKDYEKERAERKEGSADYAFTDGIYEIHGNVRYMRCSNEECDAKFFPAVSREEAKKALPKCKDCQSIMKPHCMFFDEFYQERFYRDKSVTNFM